MLGAGCANLGMGAVVVVIWECCSEEAPFKLGPEGERELGSEDRSGNAKPSYF